MEYLARTKSYAHPFIVLGYVTIVILSFYMLVNSRFYYIMFDLILTPNKSQVLP